MDYVERQEQEKAEQKENQRRRKEEAKEKKEKDKKKLQKEIEARKELQREEREKRKRNKQKLARMKTPRPKKEKKTSPTAPQPKEDSSQSAPPAAEEPKKDSSPTTPPPPSTPTKEKPTEEKGITSIIDTLRRGFHISDQALTDIVIQEAKNYALLDENGNITLVGSTLNQLKNMNLKSDTILYDVLTKHMTAMPKKDSSEKAERISFSQNNKVFRMDKMIYNPVTKKAILTNLQTKEGDLYIHSSRVKQENDSLFYGQDGIFSTCNYFPPHFSFRTRKFKLVRERTIITGSLYVNFEDVPLPPKIFVLPFAILPVPRTRTSGVQIPTLYTDGINGFGLENFGYYWAPSPYFDVKILGSYFASGLYRAGFQSNYLKKYKFSGRNAFDYQYKQNGTSEDADYSINTNFKIQSSFTLDPKVNPSISFSFNINIINDANYNINAVQLAPIDRLNNSYSSSVSFAKTFERGIFQRITANLSHSQNTNTERIDLGLPSLNIESFQINPISLFSSTPLLGTHWYDKLRFQYTLRFDNRVNLTQNNFSLPNIIDMARWNAEQRFPFTLTLPKIGPLTLTPGISYSQNLTDQSTRIEWSNSEGKVDTFISRGIFINRHSLPLSLNWNLDDIIGMLQFKEEAKVRAVRHIVRLSGSFTYNPDLNSGSFYSTTLDNSGRVRRINIYDGSAYVKQESGSLGFNLGNVIQAKWKKRKPKGDTTSGIKEGDFLKRDLITINLSNQYNLLADSFNLNNFSLSYTANISEKLSFSGSANIDPYHYENGERTKEYVWDKGVFGIGSVTSFSMSFSLAFSGDKKNNNNPSPLDNHRHQEPLSAYPGERYDVLNQTLDVIRRNNSAFVDFNIPWSLRSSFSINYSRGSYNSAARRFDENITASANFSGDLSLTPKWKVGFNGLFDIAKLTVTTLGINISRDLHCWQMTININPIGDYKSFGFIIQPKSSVLQDLKITQTRSLF